MDTVGFPDWILCWLPVSHLVLLTGQGTLWLCPFLAGKMKNLTMSVATTQAGSWPQLVSDMLC